MKRNSLLFKLLALLCLLALCIPILASCDDEDVPDGKETSGELVSTGDPLGTGNPAIQLPIVPPQGDPYELSFTSNDDGTCSITGVTFNPAYKQHPITLAFPAISPEGETVTAIEYDFACYAPVLIKKETFENRILKPLAELYADQGGTNSYYYNKLCAYFMLRDPAALSQEEAKQQLLKNYPICALSPVYEVVPDATLSERQYLNYALQEIGFSMQELQAAYKELIDLVNASSADNKAEMLAQIPSTTGVADYASYNIIGMTFPESLERLAPTVFAGCSTLETLVIPNCVKQLSEEQLVLLNNNQVLKELTLPDGLEVLEFGFYGCVSLTKLSLPASLTGFESLSVPNGLKEITFRGTVAQWEAIEKGTHWNEKGSIETVHCSNGDVTVSG